MMRQRAHAVGPNGNTGAMALFAVASLLLTFFVALNAMSVREAERTRAVVDSFTRRGAAPAAPVSVVPLGGDMPAVRSVERRWSELFPDVGLKPSPFGEGRVLKAMIDADAAFAAGTADLAPEAARRLDAVARLVNEPPAELGLDLEVRLGVAPGDDPHLAALRARAILLRLGALAAMAAADGDVVVGLAREPRGEVELALRLARRTSGASPAPSPGKPAPARSDRTMSRPVGPKSGG